MTDPESEPGIDGFAFEGQDAEGAFVDAPQGLVPHEAFQSLDPQGKFAQRQAALRP